MSRTAFDDLRTFAGFPFHIGARAQPSNSPWPDMMPFTLAIDEAIGCLAQSPNPEISRLLAEVYAAGDPIGTPMADDGLGLRYCRDFVEVVTASLGREDLRGLRVLEVGCGFGQLLVALQEAGAHVVGLDPRQTPSHLAEEAGIEVIHLPFEEADFGAKFDLVVHFMVLEHIEEPETFMARQLELLEDNGHLIFAVPDCEPYLRSGDLSILVHEHWSYFTETSLARLAARVDAMVVASEASGFGGLRHSVWRRGASADAITEIDDGPRHFANRVQQGIHTIGRWLEDARTRRETVGIFVPARFFNYRSQVETSGMELRYFDDDPTLTGRYYPPDDTPIESRAALLESPPDTLLVMSRSFGDLIRQSLHDQGLVGCRMSLVAELLDR